MNVSFTGTRAGMTNAQKETFWALLQELGAKVLTHGNCVGADADAHVIAMRLGLTVRKRPCNILRMQATTVGGEFISEPDEPLKRDRDIVEDGAVLIATPDSRQEKRRSGTWYTMRYAWSKKKLVYVIFPDGAVASGITKETTCSDFGDMQIVALWNKDANLFHIKCSCGCDHVHRADRNQLVCPQCKAQENLQSVRDRWTSS